MGGEVVPPALVYEVGLAGRAQVESLLNWLNPLQESGIAFRADGNESSDTVGILDGLLELATGRWLSVGWESFREGVAWVGVHGPHSQPRKGCPWLVSFEYSGVGWVSVLDSVVSISLPIFLAVSIEEGLETDTVPTGQSFPWDHWRLVLVDMESDHGERSARVRRIGPGYGRIHGECSSGDDSP